MRLLRHFEGFAARSAQKMNSSSMTAEQQATMMEQILAMQQSSFGAQLSNQFRMSATRNNFGNASINVSQTANLNPQFHFPIQQVARNEHARSVVDIVNSVSAPLF